MKNLWNKAKQIIAQISLVDRFLIAIMFILLLYTAVSLLAGTSDAQEANAVDVIVRTAAAAVFGYMISSNFVKTSATGSTAASYSTVTVPTVTTAESPKGQIGFAVTDSAAETETGGTASLTDAASAVTVPDRMQVVVVSLIGIFALALLFLIRAFIPITTQVTATISQLRDFVSACIGFLVSCKKAQ